MSDAVMPCPCACWSSRYSLYMHPTKTPDSTPRELVPRFHAGDVLQEQPLLRVHGERLVVADGEAGCIEEVDSAEKLAQPGVRHPRPALLPRRVAPIAVPSLEGNLVAPLVGDDKGVAAADVFAGCPRVPVSRRPLMATSSVRRRQGSSWRLGRTMGAGSVSWSSSIAARYTPGESPG